MAEAKTKPTGASVEAYLAAKASPEQLKDCRTLIALLKGVTKQDPKMWGPSIVGFGSYRYTYASGRTGESCLTGFAVRGSDFVVYLACEGPKQQALLPALGKCRMGKSCLYFKRLADLDAQVLEALVADSVAEVALRHDVGA